VRVLAFVAVEGVTDGDRPFLAHQAVGFAKIVAGGQLDQLVAAARQVLLQGIGERIADGVDVELG
jgi:hypothetical protein